MDGCKLLINTLISNEVSLWFQFLSLEEHEAFILRLDPSLFMGSSRPKDFRPDMSWSVLRVMVPKTISLQVTSPQRSSNQAKSSQVSKCWLLTPILLTVHCDYKNKQINSKIKSTSVHL